MHKGYHCLLSSIPHRPAENRRQSVSGGPDEEKLARASWEIAEADSVITRALLVSKDGLSAYTSSSDSQKKSFDSASADYHDDCDSVVRVKDLIFGVFSSLWDKFSEFLQKKFHFYWKMGVKHCKVHARTYDASAWTRPYIQQRSRSQLARRSAPLSMTRALTIRNWNVVNQTSVCFTSEVEGSAIRCLFPTPTQPHLASQIKHDVSPGYPSRNFVNSYAPYICRRYSDFLLSCHIDGKFSDYYGRRYSSRSVLGCWAPRP